MNDYDLDAETRVLAELRGRPAKATALVRIERVRELEAENARLKAERDEFEGTIEALDEKLRSLAPHGSCACSYDRPGDVGMHHSPKLDALCNAAQAVISYDGDDTKPPFTDLLLVLEAAVSRARPAVTVNTGD